MLFYLLGCPGVLLPVDGDLLMGLIPKHSVEFLDVAVLDSAGWWLWHTSGERKYHGGMGLKPP